MTAEFPTGMQRSLHQANFPDVSDLPSSEGSRSPRPSGVDVLLVNPPSPDGGVWIRCQHRVGRRSRENMLWPQVSLAQLAAMLTPEYTVEIVDAIATRQGWDDFAKLLEEKRPKYYITHVTGPTLRNDMYGVFLAKSVGARTMTLGTHATPMTKETMAAYPALDFVLRGEPEATLRDLLDTLDGKRPSNPSVAKVLRETELPDRGTDRGESGLGGVAGLAWRQGSEVIINPDRGFIPNLDDLPLPLHHLLPLQKYRVPGIRGPFTFIVTSRGCPAACMFCIKHVNYQSEVRLRSPENILAELRQLDGLGIRNVHMCADLFTVSRDQVTALCSGILESGLRVHWTCNSRVDFVDQELLRLMSRAGCWLVSWGIESADQDVLRRARKGYRDTQVAQALGWAHAAGLKNWGYFIIGLPGETEDSIKRTIAYSKALPLDLALFHIAAPHPGTPFFKEVLRQGWFKPGSRWEEIDMDRCTVLNYPGLPADRMEYWQRRATREWALRPGPALTFLKSLNSWEGCKSAFNVAWQMFKFAGR